MAPKAHKNRPHKFATPGDRHIDFHYGAKMTIVLPIYPVLLHLGLKFKCLYLCFRCLETFWQCPNLRQGAAVFDFKMAAICFTLLCISLPIALGKENKHSLYLGKVLLCGTFHHMAAISEVKMATTLSDMQFSMTSQFVHSRSRVDFPFKLPVHSNLK